MKNFDTEYLQSLKEKRNKHLQDSVAAQLALGFRFENGITVSENCETSVAYIEQPARLSVDYVSRTHGLDTLEKLKLNLIGPFVIPEGSMQIDRLISQATNNLDIVDLLDLQGNYGNTDSLNFLGLSYMQGSGQLKRDFKKAREQFLKSLKVDSKDIGANYRLGVLHMLGLGCDVNMTKALHYFEVAKSDAHALNAIGVIYFIAPDVFETDPVKLYQFGKIRRDLKKSIKTLEEAAEKGNLNARYNLGILHLDEKLLASKFSLGKAYDYFKSAASKGHTLSSYNLAVMNYLGYGTYRSCKVALTFFKHVNSVGELSQMLKRAHKLIEQGKYLQGGLIYMELAEQGFGVAALNFALLLERVDVFQTDRTLLGQISLGALSESFEINRQIAMKYLQFATYSKETESEASLKLAEFFYHGTSGLQSYPEAIRLYKIVEDTSSKSEIRSHALYQLGIVHQFGEGVPINNQMAQIYYDQAIKEHGAEKVPIYLMSLYNSWQSLKIEDMILSLTQQTDEKSWSRSSLLLLSQIGYLLIVFCTVRFLRKDNQRDD